MKFYLVNEKELSYTLTADLIMRVFRLEISESEKAVLSCLIFFNDEFCVDSLLLALRCGLSEETTLLTIKSLVYRNMLVINDESNCVIIDYSVIYPTKNRKQVDIEEEKEPLSKRLKIIKITD